jgi:hypothetical protein
MQRRPRRANVVKLEEFIGPGRLVDNESVPLNYENVFRANVLPQALHQESRIVRYRPQGIDAYRLDARIRSLDIEIGEEDASCELDTVHRIRERLHAELWISRVYAAQGNGRQAHFGGFELRVAGSSLGNERVRALKPICSTPDNDLQHGNDA